MIKLTANEEKTLEGIKDGMNAMQIANQCQCALETVRGHIRNLLRKDIIVKNGKNGFFNKYRITNLEYVVDRIEYAPKIKLVFDPGEDKLLNSAMNTPLTDDQLFYLQQHKNNKRSILAKRLGITRLQLNFALEKLS